MGNVKDFWFRVKLAFRIMNMNTQVICIYSEKNGVNSSFVGNSLTFFALHRRLHTFIPKWWQQVKPMFEKPEVREKMGQEMLEANENEAD